MKANRKFNLLIILAIVFLFVLSGCSGEQSESQTSTEMPADDFGVPILFDVVYSEDLPLEIRVQVESMIVNRGYYRWTTEDGTSYLLVSSGERPTGGYGIELVSFGTYDEVYKVLVGEGKPGADAIVPQILTYPYVVVRFEGALEVTEIFNETSEEFKVLDAPQIEVLSIEGEYQGQIDNTSIEVKVGEDFMAFRSNDFGTQLEGLATGDKVKISYSVNSDNQNLLYEISK